MVRLNALCLGAAAATAPLMVAAFRPSPLSPSDPLLLSPSSFLGEGPSSTFGFMEKAGRLVPQLRQVPLPPEAKPRKALEGILARMKTPKVAAPAAPRLQPQALPRGPVVAPKPVPRPPVVPKVGIALPRLHKMVPRAQLFPGPPGAAAPRAAPPVKPPREAAAAGGAVPKVPIQPKAPAGPNVTQSPFLRLLKLTKPPREPEKVPELPDPIAPTPGVNREAILKTLGEEVVQVMDVNSKAKSADKEKLGRRLQFPVEAIAIEAMSEMSNEPDGTFVLTDIRDAITGKQIVEKCTATHLRVLGVGGMGVVEAMVVADDEAARVLGARELAVKLTYAEVPQEDRSDKLIDAVTRGLREMYAQETEPLKAVAKQTGGKASAQDITEGNGWALPLYEGKVGVQEQALYFKDAFAFLSDIVISKVMRGDASVLTYASRTGQTVARPSAAAKERICADLISSTAKLHDQNIMHYDIKPENILVGENGRAYLADFGMTGPKGELRHCMSKLTPLYMDPKQASCARIRDSLRLTPKYDSWSVGMTCYILMTNQRLPYNLTPSEDIVDRLSGLDPTGTTGKRGREAPALPHPEDDLRKHGISGFWAKVVAAMLDRNRDRRPTPQEIVKKYSYWPLGQEGNQ